LAPLSVGDLGGVDALLLGGGGDDLLVDVAVPETFGDEGADPVALGPDGAAGVVVDAAKA
ncbi:MAG TPA: hypothetical protein VF028_08255, partial [Actinomycetota bacterium]|nr:hypothetical protein [Actinomycetota bacterium]